MEITGAVPDPSGLEAAAPSCYVGAVHIQTLSTPFDNGLELRFVRLEPGARSRPHVCSSGRLLHVVGGEAVVAAPNDRAVVGPGDTVTVPAGEWHWHGGLPHVAAVLLVIERPADVSWDAPARDWSAGYDPPAPTGGRRAT
jgi:quercetin dioxygenase-like cupin family protein